MFQFQNGTIQSSGIDAREVNLLFQFQNGTIQRGDSIDYRVNKDVSIPKWYNSKGQQGVH